MIAVNIYLGRQRMVGGGSGKSSNKLEAFSCRVCPSSEVEKRTTHCSK